MSSLSGRAGATRDAADPRSKASRRDEAIRRRVEADLLRKRTAAISPGSASPGHASQSRRTSDRRSSSALGAADVPRAAVGTVSSLRPLPALTVPQSISVADASQLCAAKRTDCVLVVDDDEHLAGILSAKDLAFRVVAAGWDPRLTPVSAIMTRSPVVTRDSTSSTEALSLMVARGFRHLPVCNDDGDVVGLLDIARVFYGALTKLERAHGSSQKLYAALEGLQSEWDQRSDQQLQMMEYIATLRERMALPDLASVLDAHTVPVTVNVRTTVREAARLMKQHRVTAVCVMDTGSASYQSRGVTLGKMAGIFTSKDVVLRVIAAGIDPRTCSVVRVMTPHPDTAPPTLSIQEALRKMHDGHYLNMPVVEDNQLLGVVDVLKLTWKTLEQINNMNDEASLDADDTVSMSIDGDAAGPMWNRFWNSFALPEGDPEEEAADDSVSLSASGMSNSVSRRHVLDRVSTSKIPRCASRQSVHSSNRRSLRGDTSLPTSAVGDSVLARPETPANEISTDLGPGDSASATGVQPGPASPWRGPVHSDGLALDPVAAVTASARLGPTPHLSTETFQFKFATPSRRTHRFATSSNNFQQLRKIITQKLASDDFFRSGNATDENAPVLEDFTVAYEDDEGDDVVVTSNDDLAEAVRTARDANAARVMLILQGGPSWQTDLARTRVTQSRSKTDAFTRDAALAAVAEEDEARLLSSTVPSRSISPVPSGVRHRAESVTNTSGHSHRSRKSRADIHGDASFRSDTSLEEGFRPHHCKSRRESRRPEATRKPAKEGAPLLGFFSRDMALPMAISFLGVSLLAAVIVSRPR